MLVLGRLVDQTIEITAPDGTRIDVTVCDVRAGGKVRLGVTAPKECTVHRREVADAIRRENRAAAK